MSKEQTRKCSYSINNIEGAYFYAIRPWIFFSLGAV